MKHLEFKRVEESILDTMFFKEEWMSGDADAYEYIETPAHVSFSVWNKYPDPKMFEKEIEQYKILSRLTDINHADYAEGPYGRGPKVDIKAKYGKKMAHIYDEIPADSTCCDYNAYLSGVTLVAIDEAGARWEAKIDLK